MRDFEENLASLKIEHKIEEISESPFKTTLKINEWQMHQHKSFMFNKDTDKHLLIGRRFRAYSNFPESKNPNIDLNESDDIDLDEMIMIGDILRCCKDHINQRCYKQKSFDCCIY